MAIHYSNFNPIKTFPDGTQKSNNSQRRFLKSFYQDVLPKSLNDLQIVILSGAMGSGKSLAIQYLTTKMSIDYPLLQVRVARLSIKAAAQSFFRELKVMIPEVIKDAESAEQLTLKNGSHIMCRGWADKNLSKVRSDNAHIYILEEATEDARTQGNNNINYEALKEMVGRTRNPNGPNIIFIISNPDDPEHWLYQKYISKAGFINGQETDALNRVNNVHVYYSITTDNPFIRESYKDSLAQNMSPKQSQRYIFGKWVSLAEDGIYNEFNEDEHYHKDKKYVIDRNLPINLSFDFNTAAGKPMSACIFQYKNDHIHVYDEVVLNGNTKTVLDELVSRGFFEDIVKNNQSLIILGDGAGWATQSSGGWSDFLYIQKYINELTYNNQKVMLEMKAGRKNPEIAARHKVVNYYLKNLKNQIRVSIYPPAHDEKATSTLVRGLKSTQLKKGSRYLEDDSNSTQHITTAFGYAVFYYSSLTTTGSKRIF
jgi:PBSX family phage terminase large subunit